MVLPKRLNLNMKNGSHNDTEEDKLNHVIIKDGQIVQGRIDKRIMNVEAKESFILYLMIMVINVVSNFLTIFKIL